MECLMDLRLLFALFFSFFDRRFACNHLARLCFKSLALILVLLRTLTLNDMARSGYMQILPYKPKDFDMHNYPK
jgi:hypothetical protein